METLIGILLYIGALTTNVEYTEAEIYSIETQNQTSVESVEGNPTLFNSAMNELGDYTIEALPSDKIVIADDMDW